LLEPKGDLKALRIKLGQVAQPVGHGDHRFAGLKNWWTGDRAQEAWLDLHHVEEGIEESRADLAPVVRHAREHVQGDANATKQLNDELREAGDVVGEKKGVAVDSLSGTRTKSPTRNTLTNTNGGEP
jgi:hypothetical protein